MEWCWKKGEPGLKTKRVKKNESEGCDKRENSYIDEQKEEVRNYIFDTVFKDNSELDSLNMGKLTFKKDNMREQNNEKLFSRGHIIQRKVNPFMINNDFNQDLEVQNQFLIPKDSNAEKDLNK